MAAAGRGRDPRRLRRPPRVRTNRAGPAKSGSPPPSSRAEQSLGQTSLMQIGVRNESEDTIPALTYTISIAGKARRRLDPPVRGPRSPARARPARPAGLGPRRALSETRRLIETGRSRRRGAKTYTFGPLKPGEKTEAVWKLSATRKGSYRPPLLDRLDRRRQARDPGRRQARRLVRGDDQPRSAGRHRQRRRRSRRNRRTEEPHQVAFLPMEGGARACLIAIALALVALQSCGAGSGRPGGSGRTRRRPGAASA